MARVTLDLINSHQSSADELAICECFEPYLIPKIIPVTLYMNSMISTQIVLRRLKILFGKRLVSLKIKKNSSYPDEIKIF